MARTTKPFRIIVASTGELFSTVVPTFADFESAHREMYHLESDLKRIGCHVNLAVARIA